MTVITDLAPLPPPRADEPRPPPVHAGFFGFASSSLAGLPIEFWTLQAYLFFQLSVLDEEIAVLERFRPRAFLGAFTLLVALARLVFRAVQHGERPPRPAAPTTWLLAFVVAEGFATLLAFDYSIAQPAFQEHLTVLVGYLLIVTIVRTRRELLLTVLTLCFGGGVFLAYSFWEYLGGRMDYAQGVVRMIGVGRSNADANSFGATIVFLLPLVVWVGVTAQSWFLRLCALGYGALTAVCVLRTSSRSALVLLAMNVLFVLALLPRGAARWTGVVLVAALGAFLLSGLSEEQTKRIRSIWSSDTYQKDMSTRGRIEGYEVGWRIFTENPVLGIGPGNWPAYRTRKVDGNPLEPHNLTGQLIATRGAAGTLTFVGYLVASIVFSVRLARQRWRSPDPWDRAVARLAVTGVFVLLLLLVAGLAGHNLERPNWVWMPALVVAAAACKPESVLDRPEPRREPFA
jgi:O-antigen ligase